MFSSIVACIAFVLSFAHLMVASPLLAVSDIQVRDPGALEVIPAYIRRDEIPEEVPTTAPDSVIKVYQKRQDVPVQEAAKSPDGIVTNY